jgi:predicted trehalose synthase
MITTAAEMTDKQRRALEAMEAARQQGCSLTEYAKTQGLAVRELYDALAALRRKGVLPKPAGRSKSKFVSVRVAPASASMMPTSRPLAVSSVLCRIVHATGYAIECMQWPPPSWVAALSSGSTDAAS